MLKCTEALRSMEVVVGLSICAITLSPVSCQNDDRLSCRSDPLPAEFAGPIISTKVQEYLTPVTLEDLDAPREHVQHPYQNRLFSLHHQ